MLIRVWRGRVRHDSLPAFHKFTNQTALPLLQKQDGFIQATVGTSKADDTQFIVVSLWRDVDSLKKFLGPEWDKAFMHPEEVPILDGNPTVEHYDVFSKT